MKKKLLIGLACFAVIAAAATVTISTINANTPQFSDLMLENLQVLSWDEGNNGECQQRASISFEPDRNCDPFLAGGGVRTTTLYCDGHGGGCHSGWMKDEYDCYGILVDADGNVKPKDC